jgi:hypothetical protein
MLKILPDRRTWPSGIDHRLVIVNTQDERVTGNPGFTLLSCGYVNHEPS